MPDVDPAPETAAAPPIVVGWVLAGSFGAVQREAITQARADLLRILEASFSGFRWRTPVIKRKDLKAEGRVEPVDLLTAAANERDRGQWDFALIVTEADLHSFYRPFMLGAPAQSLACAVCSLARLEPTRADGDEQHEARVARLRQRLTALALHLFGHLAGADHSENDPTAFLHNARTAADLDAMTRFCPQSLTEMQDTLEDVADPRLEEQMPRKTSRAAFYLRAMWHNRAEIAEAIWEMRPWLFPFLLSRLTTAAVSTMIILIITAEAWDLGMSQPPARLVGLALVALAGTSFYIVKRQHLLVHRRAQRLKEQVVVTEVSVLLGIAVGMLTTFALLFVLTLALSLLLFGEALVVGWAASLGGNITFLHYLTLAGFVATLGLLTGALGASFEEQTYFRHVAYVDEET